MCLFHKWGKWSQYESTSIQSFYGIRFISCAIHQTRTCQRCGYSQDEYLYGKDIAKIKEVQLENSDFKIKDEKKLSPIQKAFVEKFEWPDRFNGGRDE